MGDTLLFSLKMLDVETFQVVWNDQLIESPSKYSYIGAYFARSLLSYLKVPVAEVPQVVAKQKPAETAAAVVALSEGIAALDAGKKRRGPCKVTGGTKT
ncbi:MAG: hypothetical protein GX438_09325 [Treponema sp.]|nr:hypothetical protein [Treponema sp.]